jgi:uncharacterized metal-binding protein
VANIFFPKVIKQISEITRSLDQKIAPFLIETIVSIIAVVVILVLVYFSILYVIARISRAKEQSKQSFIRPLSQDKMHPNKSLPK